MCKTALGDDTDGRPTAAAMGLMASKLFRLTSAPENGETGTAGLTCKNITFALLTHTT